MDNKLEKRINEKADSEKAKILQGFFKTGKGEYGEGDIFLGIIVPDQRKITKEFAHISLEDIEELLNSNIHEKRMIGLFILIKRYEKANKEKDNGLKGEIFNFYLKKANENKINNWDLVDLSAPNIIGNHLIDKERDILYKLAKSSNLWGRRISIISCLALIRNNDFMDGLKISRILLEDRHDLIHKAVGWMLREIGKRDIDILKEFLKENYKKMPRTMLRYAIEKMEYEKRQEYLKGEI